MEDLFIHVGQKGLQAKDGRVANGRDTWVGTAEGEDARVGWHGNIQRWRKEKRAPQPPTTSRAPRVLCGTVWKPWDQPPLSLHWLWTWTLKWVFLGEASCKLEGNIKNEIFPTQAATSGGILMNKEGTFRESRNQHASLTIGRNCPEWRTARSLSRLAGTYCWRHSAGGAH